MLNKSFNGGTDFIIPEIKLAVDVFPLPALLPSQTVILSIFIFLTASTCVFTNSGNLSVINIITALSGSPAAAFTICAYPSACFVNTSYNPRASASILAKMASASPFANRRKRSASASASIIAFSLSICAGTTILAACVAFSLSARAISASFSAM